MTIQLPQRERQPDGSWRRVKPLPDLARLNETAAALLALARELNPEMGPLAHQGVVRAALRGLFIRQLSAEQGDLVEAAIREACHG